MYGERPDFPGGSMGGPDQERLMQEAERERLAKETEEVNADEAAETGMAPEVKRPWWKFWA
jgi:hypothetical protein